MSNYVFAIRSSIFLPKEYSANKCATGAADMSQSDSHYQRTINDLVAKIAEKMKPIIEDKRVVNQLCAHAGLPPRYPDVEADAVRGAGAIKRDQFHAKPLATAVREFLEQRGPSDQGGQGAATVNEIYDALVAGGYRHEASDEANAKRALRIALTKNSVTFYRVTSGDASAATYGLLEWYPNAKPQGNDQPNRGTKRKRGRPAKNKQHRKKRRRVKITQDIETQDDEPQDAETKPNIVALKNQKAA
jgi:hypothetical protein